MAKELRIKTLKVEDLLPADYNPRVDLKPGDKVYEQLKRSIEEFGYVEPIVWNEVSKQVVGGHQRLKILKDMGVKEVRVSVVHLDENEEKALNVALNKITGDWDTGKLDELIKDLDAAGFDVDLTGFSMSELDSLVAKATASEKAEKKPLPIREQFEIPEEVWEELEDRAIYFAFSGGRDSSLAAYLVIPELIKRGIDFHLCWVDTGVEIPSVNEYAARFASHFGKKLTVLKSKADFFAHYQAKECFPSPIHRDCIQTLIAEPLDAFGLQIGGSRGKDGYIEIRGGRSKQSTNKAKKKGIDKTLYTLGKGVMLYQPLYTMTQEAYDGYMAKLEEDIGIWVGYSLGFERTACWCCPFHGRKQYEALKENLPMLWDVLKVKAKEWKFHGESQLFKVMNQL